MSEETELTPVQIELAKICNFELETNQKFKEKMRGLMRDKGMDGEPTPGAVMTLGALAETDALQDNAKVHEVDSAEWLLMMISMVGPGFGFDGWVAAKAQLHNDLTDPKKREIARARLKRWHIKAEPTPESLLYVIYLEKQLAGDVEPQSTQAGAEVSVDATEQKGAVVTEKKGFWKKYGWSIILFGIAGGLIRGCARGEVGW